MNAISPPSPADAPPSGGTSLEERPDAKPLAEKLIDLRREIARRFGVPSVTLSCPRPEGREVLPTGCVPVDELLPGGGIPRGRLTEISGPESSGKTSLVARLAAQVLTPGPQTVFPERGGERVAWVDPEKAFYAPAAARAGMPLPRLLLVQPGLILRDYQGPTARGPFEAFRAAEHLLLARAFALVVIDAVGLPGRGIASPLYRLSRLALRSRTAVVLLTDHPERVSSLGSCVALRLCIERRAYCFEPSPRPPFDLSGYRIEVHVGKAKFAAPWGASRDGGAVDVTHRGGLVA